MDEIFIGTDSYRLGTGTPTFGTRVHHICKMLYQVPPFWYHGTITLLPPSCKRDSARKLNGFLPQISGFYFILSDVAFPQANQMAGKGRAASGIFRLMERKSGLKGITEISIAPLGNYGKCVRFPKISQQKCGETFPII